MPLAVTGVPRFLAANPSWDGRGVLIAILDTGVDPGAAGLDSTSTGRAKILDIRDFSGEGAIPLLPVNPRGDSVGLPGGGGGGKWVTGMSRVRGATAGPWFAGILSEIALGQPPASDVNGNGRDADSLLVVVGRGTDGWVLFADTDNDGSLGNERPVRDYLHAHETFGWHQAGETAPLSLAVNLTEGGSAAGASSAPSLHLVFDTEAHGTHVAGIAAGRRIGGVQGFDGVAPGAQLIALKISRNDFGGVSTTGSMVAAMDYAIRAAAARRLPLVINMSFGVGNEREGAARIDHLVDSILAAHPEVVFVTSAGNDGPGLSTMGFPGSARRAITVGGIQANVFLPGNPRVANPLLFFSARGGELAKPDVTAPGTAFSTVPAWSQGDEIKSGTSMAAPHIAGLAALLLSAAADQHKAITAADVRRALVGSARPVPGQSPLDAGAGLPEIGAAWQILQSPAPSAEFAVDIPAHPGATAALARGPGAADSLVTFRITRTAGSGSVAVSFTSDASWLRAPGPLRLDQPVTVLTLRQQPPVAPGTHTATVRAHAEGVAGPIFRLVSTVIVPASPIVAPVRDQGSIGPGAQRRVSFPAQAGRPFAVRIEAGRGEQLVAALHQPGGQPAFGDNGVPAGSDTLAATWDVDGRDALDGWYEAVAVAPHDGPVTARVWMVPVPVALSVAPWRPDSVRIELRSLEDSAATGILRFGLLGGERSVAIDTSGSADVAIPVRVPPWASEVVADLVFDREQWPRFTDFGFAALDESGRILEKEPANYSRTRLIVPLPESSTERTVRIVLAPGFADVATRERWKAGVTIRLIASQPQVLAAREGDTFDLAGHAAARFHARTGPLPWALPVGFRPLLLFIVESNGVGWTWQLPLVSSP